MEIYLIRHTTPDVSKGVCYGQTDLELADSFEEELGVIKSKIPQEFEEVYSSPLKRCHHLSRQIHGGSIALDDRVKELNFGHWEMEKWDDLPKVELEVWMKDFVNLAPPSGETFLEMSQRVLHFWEELTNKKSARTTAVVTHSGVIRIIKAHLEGTPLIECFNYQLQYGEVLNFTV